MNTIQRIAKNMGVLFVSQFVGYIFSFVFVMYAARYLGVEGFGILSFALAFTGIFNVFTDLGLRHLTVREIARDKSMAGKYIGNIIVIKLILVVVTFGLVALLINFLGYHGETITVVYLIMLSVILGTFSQMFYSIFRAYEKMEYQSLGQLLNGILMLLGGLLVIKQRFGLIGFASLYFLVNLIILNCNFTIYLCKLWKSDKPKMEIDWRFWKATIKMALPFSFTIIIAGLFFNIDIVMLSSMKGDEFAGLYRSAVSLILVIIFIADAFIHAVFPVTSKLYISSKNSLKSILERSSKYLFILGLPIAAGTFMLSEKFIVLIYGNEFYSAVTALRILSLYLPLRFISHITGWTLASINKEYLRTFSAGIALCLNVLLNVIFIPLFDIAGASMATVASQILLFSLFFYFVAKNFHRISLHRIFLKPCISCSAMILFLIYFNGYNLFFLIVISMLIYFSLLYALKTFDSYDKKIFGEIVGSLGKLSHKKSNNSNKGKI